MNFGRAGVINAARHKRNRDEKYKKKEETNELEMQDIETASVKGSV